MQKVPHKMLAWSTPPLPPHPVIKIGLHVLSFNCCLHDCFSLRVAQHHSASCVWTPVQGSVKYWVVYNSVGCSIVEPSVQVLVCTPVVCVHFSAQTNTSFYYRVQSCSISACDNFEIPSIRSVFGCHNTKDPNVPLCSSSALVLRKMIHHNMSRSSILSFTLTDFTPLLILPPKLTRCNKFLIWSVCMVA